MLLTRAGKSLTRPAPVAMGCPGIRSAGRRGGQDLGAGCGESPGSRCCSLMKGVGSPRGEGHSANVRPLLFLTWKVLEGVGPFQYLRQVSGSTACLEVGGGTQGTDGSRETEPLENWDGPGPGRTEDSMPEPGGPSSPTSRSNQVSSTLTEPSLGPERQSGTPLWAVGLLRPFILPFLS